MKKKYGVLIGCMIGAAVFSMAGFSVAAEDDSQGEIKQFISDYERVSKHTLTDYEETFSDSATVNDNRCQLEIENDNWDDEGDFEVTIHFGDAKDDDIAEVFRNCLTVFGVAEDDIEELTENFNSQGSLFEIDEDLLEDNYGDDLTISFEESRRYRPGRALQNPGNIKIVCRTYRPETSPADLNDQASMANPVHEVTKEEMKDESLVSIDAPDGAEDVKYSVIETEDMEYMAQVDFIYDGHAYYYRAMMTELTELTATSTSNISGLYYKFDEPQDTRIDCWDAKIFIAKEAGYISWLEGAPGILHNLCSAEPVDAETLETVANACYKPAE